eukprot:1947930-Pleurochrysis_carterae.AAC.1
MLARSAPVQASRPPLPPLPRPRAHSAVRPTTSLGTIHPTHPPPTWASRTPVAILRSTRRTRDPEDRTLRMGSANRESACARCPTTHCLTPAWATARTGTLGPGR